MRNPFRIHGTVMLGVVLSAGCAEIDTPLPVLVRDSAGVTIVESHQPGWAEVMAWRLSEEPILSFGQEESLFQIRGARRLDDGRFVLGHASVPEVMIYSPEGSLLERLGSRGSGPGEFLEFSRYQTGTGDSIMVFDYPNQRLSVLDGEGRYRRSLPTPSLPTGGIALPEDVFSDGSLLVTPFGGPPVGNGLVRRDRELWRLSPEGASAFPIVTFPELEQFFFERGGGQALRRPFFGKTAYYITGGERLLWARSDAFEIHVHGSDGRLVSVYRKRHPERAFTQSDVEWLIEDVVSGLTDTNAQRSRRTALQELPTSGSVPALGWPDYGPSFGPALQLDDSDNLWVAEYYMPGETRNARTVMDATGEWLGSVELPLGFSPHHIGEDFILGVWRDELDVEEVRMYHLMKPRE